MTHPGRLVGEILHSLGYEILGGETIYQSGEGIDIIGVLERTDRKPHKMDPPGTFFGRRISLIRVHGESIILEVLGKAHLEKASVIQRMVEDAGYTVRVDLLKKSKKETELRFR